MSDFNFPGLILEYFGLKKAKIHKEKTYYVCESAAGEKLKIYRTQAAPHEINLAHSIKEHVVSSGFPYVDRFLVGETGKPYVSLGRDTYVAVYYAKGREIHFDVGEDVLRGIEALAHFHKSARGGIIDGVIAPPSLLTTFAKESAELAGYVKQVRRKSALSEFDVLFIKHADYYTEQISKAIDSLNQGQYDHWFSDAAANRHICHGAVKEETMSITAEGECYISDFSSAAVDLQLNDLAAMIRRHANRAGQEAIPAKDLMEAYSRVIKVPPEASKLVHEMLTFPVSFMKLTAQYFSKKRAFTPNAIINRLMTGIGEKENYEAYINKLS